MGLAGELVLMLKHALKLTNPFWSTPDDQSVYATYFVHQSNHPHHLIATSNLSPEKTPDSSPLINNPPPPIKLDYCQDIFAALSGTPQTAKFATLEVTAGVGIKHVLTESHPVVAHMPGRSKRFEDFLNYMKIKKL